MRPIIRCALYMKKDPFTDTASYNPVCLKCGNAYNDAIYYIRRLWPNVLAENKGENWEKSTQLNFNFLVAVLLIWKRALFPLVSNLICLSKDEHALTSHPGLVWVSQDLKKFDPPCYGGHSLYLFMKTHFPKPFFNKNLTIPSFELGPSTHATLISWTEGV